MMGRDRKKIYKIFFIAILFIPISVFGEWSSPEEVVIGTWGIEPMQFGIDRGDTIAYDRFPELAVILKNGDIIINDWVNERTVVYTSSGSLKKIVIWVKKFLQDKPGHWTYEISEYSFGPIVVGYNSEGDVWTKSGETYFLESITGSNLQTSSTRPLELGLWRFICKLPRSNFPESKCSFLRYEIEYPDAVFVYEVTKPLFKSNLKDQVRINDNLIMDNKGYDEDCVYAYSVTATVMPDGATKPLRWLGYVTKWERPQGEYGTEIVGVEKLDVLIKEYGSPVIGPDGSIYTWMRTPTHYKILRWRWVP